MVFDTNLIIEHIRRLKRLPAQVIIPIVVAGELESFALKADWGYQKVTFLQTILDYYPLVDVSRTLIGLYAQVDAFSQGKLRSTLLPPGISSRNMGKNDIWIAATALYLDLELYTTDNDFNHLPSLGLQLIKF